MLADSSHKRTAAAAEEIRTILVKHRLSASEVVSALFFLLAPMLGSMNRTDRKSALKYQSQLVRDFTRQTKRQGG